MGFRARTELVRSPAAAPALSTRRAEVSVLGLMILAEGFPGKATRCTAGDPREATRLLSRIAKGVRISGSCRPGDIASGGADASPHRPGNPTDGLDPPIRSVGEKELLSDRPQDAIERGGVEAPARRRGRSSGSPRTGGPPCGHIRPRTSRGRRRTRPRPPNWTMPARVCQPQMAPGVGAGLGGPNRRCAGAPVWLCPPGTRVVFQSGRAGVWRPEVRRWCARSAPRLSRRRCQGVIRASAARQRARSGTFASAGGGVPLPTLETALSGRPTRDPGT